MWEKRNERIVAQDRAMDAEMKDLTPKSARANDASRREVSDMKMFTMMGIGRQGNA